MCNANVPYEWCRRSASAWYRTASGREDTTYARDPDPSGSPGTDSRPWAPSLGIRLETRPATVAAWTRSGDRLSARWQVVNWEVGCNDSVRVNFASEIIGLYSKSEYYEWPQVKFISLALLFQISYSDFNYYCIQLSFSSQLYAPDIVKKNNRNWIDSNSWLD